MDADTFGWSPVQTAGHIAISLLGLTPISTSRDIIARRPVEPKRHLPLAEHPRGEFVVKLPHEILGRTITRGDPGN